MISVKKILLAAELLLLSIFFGACICRADTYRSVYDPALADVKNREEALGDRINPAVDATYYTMFDITGNGREELIVLKVYEKHGKVFWLYRYEDNGTYFMDEIENDARQCWGYENGLLYSEYYKGSYELKLDTWDGYEFTEEVLYEGTYDRDGDPPSIKDLTDYYDSGKFRGALPAFIELSDTSYLDREIGTPIKSSSSSSSQGSSSGNSQNSGSQGNGTKPSQGSGGGSQGQPSGNSGGGSSDDGRYDLSAYGYRTVVTNGRGTLVFETAPASGSFMNAYQYADGESIYVNLSWRQNGYAIAYSNGQYGYVDADYINWSGGSSGSSSRSSSDGRYDLSNYGYRTVRTGGRGSLVFESAPGNFDFMYDYQYWEGDSIYVNLYWRSGKYAIAYSGGQYGYVDATYISW